jgi:hypothetical protein
MTRKVLQLTAAILFIMIVACGSLATGNKNQVAAANLYPA